MPNESVQLWEVGSPKKEGVAIGDVIFWLVADRGSPQLANCTAPTADGHRPIHSLLANLFFVLPSTVSHGGSASFFFPFRLCESPSPPFLAFDSSWLWR